MVFVWGFFLVAKIHFYKYRDYSRYVVISTKVVMGLLAIFTLLGMYFIYRFDGSSKMVQTVKQERTNEVY